jgi:hypothetical protein
MDDFEKLRKIEHMLKWLADDPFATIRSEVEGLLQEQVPDSILKSFRVTSEPQSLTGARKVDGSTEAILVRLGVAFEFHLVVMNGVQSLNVTGVFSWVGVNLDRPSERQQRIWFDVDGTLKTFGSEGELIVRLYDA